MNKNSPRYYCITVTTLSFKVSDREARVIRQRARRERLSVSEYLRRRAAAATTVAAKPVVSRCPVTGAKIFLASQDLPPLTVAATREMLADFP